MGENAKRLPVVLVSVFCLRLCAEDVKSNVGVTGNAASVRCEREQCVDVGRKAI